MNIPGQIPLPPPDHPCFALFQILDESGVASAAANAIDQNTLLKLHRGMLLVRVMDERLLGLQRQGRIGFYGEARGQEATVIGGAAALGPNDWLVPALRDAGGGLYRGLSLRAYIAQIFGNTNDLSKGRQLPCHPGSRQAKYVTMSSCIATQLPHAMGLAWAAKLRRDPVAVLGCLGDGATSEEDFHVAANFAGVFQVPLVLFCANNQWAISTPSSIQTAAPTFAIKGLAYGLHTRRVDGNDVLAVYTAVHEAIENARQGKGPSLIEALTYRVSAHSSSDDPSRYRDESVTETWRKRDPILRLEIFLKQKGLLDDAKIATLREELDGEVREAIAAEEPSGPPPRSSLIEDVFARVPEFLAEQLHELEAATSS